MADRRLQELKRNYAQDEGIANGRALYQEMLRCGQKDEGLRLRASLGYAEEVKALPRPTKQQCRNFAEYVAGAHSWYKHLDLKGEPFYFFLAPWAGRSTTGGELFKEHCWHYSDIPTAEHLERFGHWSYGRYETDYLVHAECGKELEVPKEFLFSALWTPVVHDMQWPLPEGMKTYINRKGKLSPPGQAKEISKETTDCVKSIRQHNATGLWELRAAWRAMDNFLKALDKA